MLQNNKFLRSYQAFFGLIVGLMCFFSVSVQAQIEVIQNGDVGIGTETPTKKLDINGGLRWREATTAGNVVVVEDALGNLTTVDIETVLAQAGGIPASNVFYVGRRFQGYANASNPAYTTQLNNATRGNITYSYPDPWSARDAAIAAMTANEISDALIYILPGQVYTYGDASNANNGTADFTSTPFEVDKKTTSATKADINLYYEGIRYYFDKSSGLKNHCSTYPIALVNIQGETAKKFELFGEGDFYNYYGQWKGWNLDFVICDNPAAIFRFSANSVHMQQWMVFSMKRAKQFTIELETAFMAGSILVGCLNITTLDPIIGSVKVKNIFNGEGVFGPYVDYWYIFSVKNAGPCDLAFEVDNIRTIESAPIFYGNDPTSYNKISVHIKNIEFQKSPSFGHTANPANNCAFFIADQLPGALVSAEIGNSYNFHIDNYIGDMPFLYYQGMNKKEGSKNNVFDVYCGNCLTRDAGQYGIGFYGGAGFNGINPDGSLLKLRGSYRTLDGPVIKVFNKTSNVEIDASLASEYAPGIFDAGALDVCSITMNATAYPQVPGTVFLSGSNLPNIRKLTVWDKTTKCYVDATPGSGSTSTLSGDVTGPLTNTQIAPNAVGTPEIANGAVTGTKIAQNGATTGQVLEWNGTTWVPSTDDGTSYTAGAGINIAGTVITNTGDTNGADDVTTTTTAGGDVSGLFSDLQIVSNAVGSTELVNTGVVPGFYPTTYAIPVIGVDADGRITSVTELPINSSPSGTASGDLSGTYPGPTVDGLQGNPVSATAPTTGQILKWNGTAWTPAPDDGTSYTAGAGISIVGTVITNTGDASSTNEIQDLSLAGNVLSLTNDPTTVNLAPYLDNTDAQTLSVVGSNLSISGGNTVTIPSAPVSSVNGQTGAVALDLSLAGSTLSLTGGTNVTLPDASSTNELQTLSVASNAVALSNGGGNFLINGAGTNTVSTVGNTITINGTGDASSTNEGVLGVGPGLATTSIITSNSAGAAGVTLAAGAGISLTETLAANGGTITIASTGAGSNWTVSGTNIYRNSSVAVGTTNFSGGKFIVDGSFNGTCLRATGGTIPSSGGIITATGSSTGNFFGIDIDASSTGNTIHRFRNTNNTGVGSNSQVKIESGGSAGGSPMLQYVVLPNVQTWSSGLDNSDADKYKISASNALATSTALTIQTNGNVGVGTTAPFVVLHAGGTGAIGMPSGLTADRPVLTGAPRMVRFNTDIVGFELGEPTKGIWYRLTSAVTPSVMVSPSGAAGAGANASIIIESGSNDVTGIVSLNTGASGVAVGDLFTVTFNKPYGGSNGVIAIVTPMSDKAAEHVARWRVSSQTNTGFTVKAVSALEASKSYVFNYRISQ